MQHANASSITKSSLLAAALVLLGISLPVWGHPGHELTSGFFDAATHPLSGLDHLLAGLSTGLLAMHLGGLERAALPGAYLLGLGAGAALATAGWGAAPIEIMLAASVSALAPLLLAPRVPRRSITLGLVALFAAFHGHAHQLESVGSGMLPARLGGFALTTVLLLLAGAVLHALLQRAGLRPAQAGSIPMALAGMVRLARALA